MLSSLWPGHAKPREDELLSSWIVRLAAANGNKLHTFTSLALPGHAIWNRDIDNSAKPDLLHRLAFRTGTSIDVVRGTTLGALEGALFEKHNPNGHTPWISPAGIYHRIRRRYALAFCPHCLAQEPYYRRAWRLAFVTVCTLHKCRLYDRCPACEAPVTFHRGDIGHRESFVADGAITSCAVCSYDFRHAKARVDSYTSLACKMQAMLEEALDYGHVLIGDGPVYSHLFFAGLRAIAQIVAVGRPSASLRKHAAALLGVRTFEPQWPGNISAIEHLSVDDRRRVMVLAMALLHDWPRRFVDVAHCVGLTASDLVGKLGTVPYWIDRVVGDELFAGSYSPSVHEIRSVIAYLRKHDFPVTKTTVSRAIGLSDALRKRQLSFLLTE